MLTLLLVRGILYCPCIVEHKYRAIEEEEKKKPRDIPGSPPPSSSTLAPPPPSLSIPIAHVVCARSLLCAENRPSFGTSKCGTYDVEITQFHSKNYALFQRTGASKKNLKPQNADGSFSFSIARLIFEHMEKYSRNPISGRHFLSFSIDSKCARARVCPMSLRTAAVRGKVDDGNNSVS